MNERVSLLDQNAATLERWFDEVGEPAYRARQVLRWIDQLQPIESMTDLPGPLKDLLRELEVFMVFDLAEIDGGKKLLETDDLRAFCGGFTGFRDGFGDVLGGVERAARLHEPEFNFGRFLRRHGWKS